jgi:hypothetical protein
VRFCLEVLVRRRIDFIPGVCIFDASTKGQLKRIARHKGCSVTAAKLGLMEPRYPP